MLNRPEVTDDLIMQINGVIADHPDWLRTKISKYPVSYTHLTLPTTERV